MDQLLHQPKKYTKLYIFMVYSTNKLNSSRKKLFQIKIQATKILQSDFFSRQNTDASVIPSTLKSVDRNLLQAPRRHFFDNFHNKIMVALSSFLIAAHFHTAPRGQVKSLYE